MGQLYVLTHPPFGRGPFGHFGERVKLFAYDELPHIILRHARTQVYPEGSGLMGASV